MELRLQALEQLLAAELDAGLALVQENVGRGESIVEVLRDKGARADHVERRPAVGEHLALEQGESRRADDLAGIETVRVERLPQLDDRGHGDAGAEQYLAHPVLDNVQAVGVERLFA